MIEKVSEIPSSFKLANQEITVKIKHGCVDNEYGYFDDTMNEIVLATKIETDKNGLVELSSEQILNSFWHELFHVFQFYYSTDTNEAEAQSYANFMREFTSTMKHDDK